MEKIEGMPTWTRAEGSAIGRDQCVTHDSLPELMTWVGRKKGREGQHASEPKAELLEREGRKDRVDLTD